MKKLLPIVFLSFAMAFSPLRSYSQISTNPNKFLGNITTYGQMDTDGYTYSDLWNQVTPENETKWSSVEGTRGSFNWYSADVSYNYAKQHKLHFKFHCFAWGSQYPEWIEKLTPEERYEEIVKWMDAAKTHFPNLELIDVVNEALPGHQRGTHFFEEALGGSGVSGYDWIVNAFELAHERWPNAILIYNDFNTFQWDTDGYINLVRSLIDAGAPIDAYGCQSHDLNDMSGSSLAGVMERIQNNLKIPMYISEYDIDKADSTVQRQRFSEHIPLMWESDYCAGITIWGFIQGKTWEDNSGISYGKGNERSAMKWLRGYMATDKAKKAGFRKNFPFENGWTKEASVYVKPSTLKPCVGDEYTVTVRASMRTKTIDHVVLYVDEDSVVMNEAPYVTTLTAENEGNKSTLKAIVYTTDGSAYTRYSHIEVYPQRKPFKGEPVALPGTVEAEDFDIGGDGFTYHRASSQKEGDRNSYRTDGAMDLFATYDKGIAVGHIASGEWMEYTVNVTKAGLYQYEAYVLSANSESLVSIGLNENGVIKEITRFKNPNSGSSSDWNIYSKVSGRITLEEGKQVIRLSVLGNTCNIDKVVFKLVTKIDQVDVFLNLDKVQTVEGDTIQLTADVQKPDDIVIDYVAFVIDGKKLAKDYEAPYEFTYKNVKSGKHTLKAVAYDKSGAESESETVTINVSNKPHIIPGVIEAEDFDVGGEGVAFHDSDNVDEGAVGYRSDNGGLDITTGNNGYVIGYTAVNEWMKYTIQVVQGGNYSFEATVSSGISGSKFIMHLTDEKGVSRQIATVNVPQTGNNSWDTYRVVSGTVGGGVIEPGQYVLKITIKGASCNIDKVKFICNTPSGVEETVLSEGGTYEVYSLTGVKVGQVEAGSDSELPYNVYRLTHRTGLYVVKNVATGKSERCFSAE